MSETKFTNGPWAVDEVRTQVGRAFRMGTGEMLKAGKGCCIIYDDYPGTPDNERRANAHLIAAAPALYGQHESNLVDLDFLRQAIEAGDPKRELLVRISDIERRTNTALSQARGEK